MRLLLDKNLYTQKNLPLRKVTFETLRTCHRGSLFLLTILTCNLLKHEFLKFTNRIQFPTVLSQDLFHSVSLYATTALIEPYPRSRFTNSVRMLLTSWTWNRSQIKKKLGNGKSLIPNEGVLQIFTMSLQWLNLFFLFDFSFTHSLGIGASGTAFLLSSERSTCLEKGYLSLIGKRQYVYWPQIYAK